MIENTTEIDIINGDKRLTEIRGVEEAFRFCPFYLSKHNKQRETHKDNSLPCIAGCGMLP